MLSAEALAGQEDRAQASARKAQMLAAIMGRVKMRTFDSAVLGATEAGSRDRQKAETPLQGYGRVRVLATSEPPPDLPYLRQRVPPSASGPFMAQVSATTFAAYHRTAMPGTWTG